MNPQIIRDKLAAAATALAKDLEAGRFKMKFLGRSTVFRDNGAPQCAVGQLITKAGLKRKMGAFRGTSFDGQPGVRWWSSSMALTHLLGIEVDALEGLYQAVDNLTAANDQLTGEARRKGVAQHLRNLSRELTEAAI